MTSHKMFYQFYFNVLNPLMDRSNIVQIIDIQIVSKTWKITLSYTLVE